MKQTALFLAVVAVLAHEAAARPFPLDSLLGTNGLIGGISTDVFMETWAEKGFAWTSDAKTTARAYMRYHGVFGRDVVETIVSFESNRMSEAVFCIYTRGDAGTADKNAFTSMAQETRAAIGTWAGSQPRTTDDQLVTGGAKRLKETWRKGPLVVDLVTSYTTRIRQQSGFRAEYIRIECKCEWPGNPTVVPLRRPARKELSLEELKKSVHREANGDTHVVDIPMIDQGEKGYCAAATVARILNYYGIETDQHELAQVANSSASAGTSSGELIAALRRIGAKIGCTIRALYKLDGQDIDSILRHYNAVAKRTKNSRKIDINEASSLLGLYSKLRPDVLREARISQKTEFDAFKRSIQQSIDAGIPPTWSVIVGLVTETPPIRAGGNAQWERLSGHMRLIVGYNLKTDELLYSDSWGSGHELKRMKFDDAWTISTGVYAVEPRYTTR